MADNTDFKNIKVDADAATVSVNSFNTAATTSSTTLQSLGAFVTGLGAAFQGTIGDLKQLNGALENNHIMAQRSAELFGVMGNAALGASKMFSEGFQDASGIQSFGMQIDSLAESASHVTGGLETLAKSFGMGQVFDKLGKPIALTTDAVTKFVKGVLAGPDAALKFQNSFLQMAAAGGNLNTIFTQTGGDLRNINDLLQTQGQMLSKAAEATNTDVKTTTAFYTALGRIPGFLNGQVVATDGATQHLNMLTAAMKLAHGTGQDENAVMQDLTTAFNDYGASGEKALEFTARISDLSQRYNVQLSDTRNYMNQTAEAFKFLGENIDSSAGIFDNYFARLKDTGLSSQAASEMTTGLTRSIASMTIAQKAFLSGQTGGPGGLMGAVQIEKDIREGKMADVMKRIESALKQQFGRIVTQQEAATSEQAAAQFVKQRMFLQQGPFGGLVKDEGQATRLLEAFAKPGGVGGQVEAQKLLSDDIKRGSDVEQKSYSQLTQTNAKLESIKMLSGIIALGVTQRSTTTAGGGELERRLLGNINDAMKEGREATTAGGKTAVNRDAQYLSKANQELDQTIANFGATTNAIGKQSKNLATTQQSVMAQHQNEYNKMADQSKRGAGVGTAAHMAAHTIPATAQVSMLDRWMAAENNKSKTPTTTPPQNITITMANVCPDCHKKFVTNQNVKSVNNAPEMYGVGPGPGF